MKRAIFLDLDGTLLPEGELHKISDFNIDKVKEAQDKGIYTVIATGRDYNYTERVHDQIYSDEYGRYAITLNGARIYDRKEDKMLWSFNLDKGLLQELIEWAEQNKYMFVLTQEKRFYVNNKYKYFYLHPFTKRFEIRKYADFKMPDYDVAKIGFFVGMRKKALRIQKELLEKYGDKIEVVTSAKGFFLEVTAKNVSKGEAIKLLTKKLGINPDHCAHFGDSMNDYPAFEVVGHRVAMKKASKPLKEKACHITGDAELGGVGNAINYLLTDVWK